MNRIETPWWRGRRGEWYVVAQFLLFGLVVFGPRTVAGGAPWSPAVGRVTGWVGRVLIVAGGVLLVVAARQLGPSLTALPAPKADATLVERGPYALVRHPIYSAVLLFAFGWALVAQGSLTLVYAIVLLILLDRKASSEERWLVERYPAYRAYRRRVRKLVPFLY